MPINHPKLAYFLARCRANVATIAPVIAVLVVAVTAASYYLHRSEPVPAKNKKTSFPSIGHIVGYNTESCAYNPAVSKPDAASQDNMTYYEIRAGSAVAPEQLQANLVATCEERNSNTDISNLVKDLPKDTQAVQVTVGFTIAAIAEDSITLALAPYYDSSIYQIKQNFTYQNFADPLKVYEDKDALRYSDLHVGDVIKMIIQDIEEIRTGTPASSNPLNEPARIKILTILRVKPLAANPDAVFTVMTGDVARAYPCPDSPSGFCRQSDFVTPKRR